MLGTHENAQARAVTCLELNLNHFVPREFWFGLQEATKGIGSIQEWQTFMTMDSTKCNICQYASVNTTSIYHCGHWKTSCSDMHFRLRHTHMYILRDPSRTIHDCVRSFYEKLALEKHTQNRI